MKKRCPNGTRKNKFGDCVAVINKKKSTPSIMNPLFVNPSPIPRAITPIPQAVSPKLQKKKRCPKGTRKNKFGDCVAVINKKKSTHAPIHSPIPTPSVMNPTPQRISMYRSPTPIVKTPEVVIPHSFTPREPTPIVMTPEVVIPRSPTPRRNITPSPQPISPKSQKKKRCPKGTRKNKFGDCVAVINKKKSTQSIINPLFVPPSPQIQQPNQLVRNKYNNPILKRFVNKIKSNIIKQSGPVRKHPKLELSYLKGICGDVGICLSLNEKYDQIMNMFNHFDDFTYLVNSPSIVSMSSANGLIRLLKYKKTVDGVSFNSYGVLKSSLNKDVDNLGYEYIIGNQYINNLCKYFPVFVPTYGWYKMTNPAILKTQGPITAVDLSAMVKLNYPKDLVTMCKENEKLCLIIQYYNNFITLKKYCEQPDAFELPFIFFQVYYALHECRKSFTHYDLHDSNVGLVKLPNNIHIDYEYTIETLTGPEVVRFKSKYIVKIIDYGRSYFSGSAKLVSDIKKKKGCPKKETHKIGIMNSLYVEMTYHVNLEKKNESHDLRLLTMMNYNNMAPIYSKQPHLQNIIKDVTFLKMYGTVENLNSTPTHSPIRNVTDAQWQFSKYIMDNIDNIVTENTNNYMTSNSLGTLRVTPNTQMIFTPNPRIKNRNDPSRFQQPDVPNVSI